MTREQEHWACAAEVLKLYGDRAPVHIASRIGALAAAGEIEGVKAWRSIAVKVDKLKCRSRSTQ